MKQLQKTGFTIIELMVVISIIGILSAVIYANFNDARTDARNKALMSEFRETQLALEVYKAQNGGYPAMISWESDLTPDFIADTPQETDAPPSKSGDACTISYWSDGDSYKLTGANCIGGAKDASEGIQPNTEFSRCPSYCGSCSGDTMNSSYLADADFYESIAVYSAGGQCE